MAGFLDFLPSITDGIVKIVDDLNVTQDELDTAAAQKTQAQANLEAVRAQTEAAQAKAALDAENSKRQWQTIQYALMGAGVLVAVVVVYKATTEKK